MGNVIAGLITIHYGWREMYYVTTGLLGFCFIVMAFTMPETSFNRTTSDKPNQVIPEPNDATSLDISEKGADSHVETYQSARPIGNKKTYLKQLGLFNGTFSSESLLKTFIRPFGILLLPPVLWSTIVTSVSVGFVISVNTNIGGAYQVVYHWKTWQVGLAYASAFIGAVLGIFWGGMFSDWIANFLTKRNGGLREPEMRLPAIMVPLVGMTVSMALYGVGLQKAMHWMVPTFALGLCEYARNDEVFHDADLICSDFLGKYCHKCGHGLCD